MIKTIKTFIKTTLSLIALIIMFLELQIIKPKNYLIYQKSMLDDNEGVITYDDFIKNAMKHMKLRQGRVANGEW